MLISVLVTAVQLWIAYGDAVDNAGARLDEIGRSIVPSIGASLWQVDTERVDLLLDGVARLPEVAYVELESRDGDRLKRGNPHAKALATRSYDLRHVEGKAFELGSLRVVVGRERVISTLIGDAISIALTTTITLVCSAMLLSLFFRAWITRHLETMADYAGALSLETLGTPLKLAGRTPHDPPDELDQMVLSFNRMRETLQSEVALRDSYESELVMHRERLEDLVVARTSELAQKSEELQVQKDEMQRLAQTDSMTGTSTRRHFRELAEHEMARSERTGVPLSVVMLDIDHFKRINDSYGHDVGDRAIKALCGACATQLRHVDAIGRWGGEEFALLLPETDLASATKVAERIREAVSEIRLGLDSGDVVMFTASLGVASFDGGHGNLDAILKGADKALYEAKQSGRNRVCAHV
jgi:diguanylate cyclase (GGDEF)-like protein